MKTLNYNPTIEEFIKEIYRHRRDTIKTPVENKRWTCDSGNTIRKDKLVELYLDPNTIIGCRFGKQTRHAVIDIDKGSIYHPNQDREAISRILDCLKSIGIEGSIIIRSSHSGGVHLIFPFPLLIESFELATLLRDTVEKNGYEVKSGQLEIFPNVKKSAKSLYNGIRLPLQDGSFILNDKFEIVTNNHEVFISEFYAKSYLQDLQVLNHELYVAKVGAENYNNLMFEILNENNCIDFASLKWEENKILRENFKTKNKKIKNETKEINVENVKQTNYIENLIAKLPHVTGKLQEIKNEFIEILNTGFTGKSQTNNLTLTIARNLRIFFDVNVEKLAQMIFDTIVNLRDYENFSSHSSEELQQRMKSVAISVNNRNWYFKNSPKNLNVKNKVTEISNIDRISQTVENILRDNLNFTEKTHFIQHIVKTANVSLSTIYNKCKELINSTWDILSQKVCAQKVIEQVNEEEIDVKRTPIHLVENEVVIQSQQGIQHTKNYVSSIYKHNKMGGVCVVLCLEYINNKYNLKNVTLSLETLNILKFNNQNTGSQNDLTLGKNIKIFNLYFTPKVKKVLTNCKNKMFGNYFVFNSS